MHEIFQEDNSQGVLLIDASNAFNSLNRQVALHNIQILCPRASIIIINTYRAPSRLFIAGGGEVLSQEGTTQGDPLAMPFYAISTSLIIQTLRNVFKDVKQVCLADDASAAGSLKSLVCFLNSLTAEGAKYGYVVNEKKSWLILKRDNDMGEAKQLFRNHSIQITSEGQRHLGAALGSSDYRNNYVNEKVNGWVKELEKLSMIAVTQPQAAYSAYVNGYKHKFTYFIRTIPDINHLLSPLVECIYERLLPAILGVNYPLNYRTLLLSQHVLEGWG